MIIRIMMIYYITSTFTNSRKQHIQARNGNFDTLNRDCTANDNACGWEKGEKGYRYFVTVPANTTAELVLPDGRRETLTAGEYTF